MIPLGHEETSAKLVVHSIVSQQNVVTNESFLIFNHEDTNITPIDNKFDRESLTMYF